MRDEEPAPYAYGMPEEDPSPDAGIAGDGLGDEVYMIAFGVAIAAIAVAWMGLGWLVNWVIFVGLIVFVWRVITVWAPARAAWLQFSARFVAASKLVWRFGVLAMKKKTPAVSSEMGHVQGFLSNTMPILSPVTLFAVILAIVGAWGGWGWFIHAPALEKKLKVAEAESAVAVGANSDWERTIAAYKAELEKANATIKAQSEAAQAGEVAAFRRGQMEQRRRYAGQQKQRRLEDETRNVGGPPTDLDSFLRDIGVDGGDAPGGGPGAGGGEPPAAPAG